MKKSILFLLLLFSFLIGSDDNETKEIEGAKFLCLMGGDASYCVSVGVYYENNKSYSEAAGFFMAGCNLYSGYSCRRLGLLYEKGNGVKQSNHEATRYYIKGCNLGDEQSCKKL